MQRGPRLMVKLGAALLVGAAITVMVAWSASWSGVAESPGEKPMAFPRGHEVLLVRVSRGFGRCIVRGGRMDEAWVRRLQWEWPYPGSSRGPAKLPPLEVSPESFCPEWSGLDTDGRDHKIALEAGWPLPSLCMKVTVDRRPVGGLVFEQVPGTQIVRGLPYIPRWPGFAVNTLLGALVVLGALEGVGFARRRRRWGHGCCPACNYDRRGLTAEALCPECGHVPRQESERAP